MLGGPPFPHNLFRLPSEHLLHILRTCDPHIHDYAIFEEMHMPTWEANSKISCFTNHRSRWSANFFPAGWCPHLPSPTRLKVFIPSSHTYCSAQKSAVMHAKSASSPDPTFEDRETRRLLDLSQLLRSSSSAKSIVPSEGCPTLSRSRMLVGNYSNLQELLNSFPHVLSLRGLRFLDDVGSLL